MHTVSGTLLTPKGTPFTGRLWFRLLNNTNVSPGGIALASLAEVSTANDGTFSIELVPGEYEIVLPNLTRQRLSLTGDTTLQAMML